MKLIPLRKGIWQRLFPRFAVSEASLYTFDWQGREAAFWIDEGYIFDGATGAQFITDNPKVHEAAAGHDLGFEKLGNVDAFFMDAAGITFQLSRQDLDKIFIQKIRDAYKDDWKVSLYRFGIKTGGFIAWKTRKWGLRK